MRILNFIRNIIQIAKFLFGCIVRERGNKLISDMGFYEVDILGLGWDGGNRCVAMLSDKSHLKYPTALFVEGSLWFCLKQVIKHKNQALLKIQKAIESGRVSVYEPIHITQK